MSEPLSIGAQDAGWDIAPWEQEPQFSAVELDILLDPLLTAAEAAERVGCAKRDVLRLRRTA
ncbi:hypothetical protein [Mycolicibacterium sp. P9-22]|uniref:hypothetical protein n=1 Tax=Mycolicibacterium sp. P9-22 TaxID=2024613 RepID=UPI0011ED01CA|nr:hypothetical protein [Mycolicibacterium sp. P9-22]KAA0115209.1 hypothetical protein CIW51_18335 [Mycolicibacterium sp. P9-22]